MLPWRDMLHDGPVPDGLGPEHSRRCAPPSSPRKQAGPSRRCWPRFGLATIACDAARRSGEPLMLWFEHDLYDQLQLLQILVAAGGPGAGRR